MVDVQERMETPETELHESYRVELTGQQTKAIELIKGSDIPDELKSHFSDMIRLLGRNNSEDQKAKQIMDIADELQQAKRVYLDNHKLENDSASDLLISEIVKIYWQ